MLLRVEDRNVSQTRYSPSRSSYHAPCSIVLSPLQLPQHCMSFDVSFHHRSLVHITAATITMLYRVIPRLLRSTHTRSQYSCAPVNTAIVRTQFYPSSSALAATPALHDLRPVSCVFTPLVSIMP